MSEEISKDFENLGNSLEKKEGPIYLVKANFLRRICAGVIDHLICLLIIYLVLSSLNKIIFNIFFSSFYFGILFLIMTLIIEIYYFICEYFLNGQTPGKKLLNIRVTNTNLIDKMKVGNLLVRNSFRCLYLLPPLFILPDLIFMVFDKQSRRIGDFVAGTVVVKKYIG